MKLEFTNWTLSTGGTSSYEATSKGQRIPTASAKEYVIFFWE